MSDLSLTKAIALSNFNAVFGQFPEDEIAIIKELYRANPESYRAWVALLVTELPKTQEVADDGFVKITPNSYPPKTYEKKRA